MKPAHATMARRSSSRPVDTTDGKIEQTANMLFEVLARAEGEMLCSVMCGHQQAIPIAEACGISIESFGQPDYRCIWTAFSHFRNANIDKALQWSAKLLQAENDWEPEEIAANWRMMRHSPATLVHMTQRRTPFTPQRVTAAANNLLQTLRDVATLEVRYAAIESLIHTLGASHHYRNAVTA